jgi:L-fuculose-phosphate aldolase
VKQVISVKDLEEMVRGGKDVRSLPEGALLTPSARDFLRDLDGGNSYKTSSAVRDAKLSEPERPVTSKSPKPEIDAYFNSPKVNALKAQICDVGRRLWQREYVDGNGGNFAPPR